MSYIIKQLIIIAIQNMFTGGELMDDNEKIIAGYVAKVILGASIIWGSVYAATTFNNPKILFWMILLFFL